MLPFTKRPAGPQEHELSAGSLAAASSVAIPLPPRAPVFDRSFPASAPVFAHDSWGASPASSPPAPNSLAPMAMGPLSQHPTGSYRAAQTFIIRGRSNSRWGMGVALAGALLGGVLGLALKHQHTHVAAAAAHAQQATAFELPANEPIPAPMAAQAVVASPAAPIVVQPQPPQLPPNAFAASSPAAKPAAEPVKVALKTAAPRWTPRATKAAAAVAAPATQVSPSHATLATKVTRPAAPVEKAEKVEKADKAGTSEAEKLLRDAKNDTESTLGGSD